MKVGLISDTHDHVTRINQAVSVFNRENVDMVFHAGDYVSPFSVKPLFSLECDFFGVWGNNDGDKVALHNISQGKIAESPYLETWAGHRLVIGHNMETLAALAASGHFSLIVHGHTHTPEVKKEGDTLIVNPGECCGWVTGKATVAIADMDALTAEIISL